jgi:hypothetical protein
MKNSKSKLHSNTESVHFDAFSHICAWLQSTGTEYKTQEDARFRYILTGARYYDQEMALCIKVHKCNDVVVVMAYIDDTIAEENRARVAEFMARINHALVFASVQMNFDTGFYFVQSLLDFHQSSLTAEQLWHALENTIGHLFNILPGIQKTVEHRHVVPAQISQEIIEQIAGCSLTQPVH